jgi:hypothetical protein
MLFATPTASGRGKGFQVRLDTTIAPRRVRQSTTVQSGTTLDYDLARFREFLLFRSWNYFITPA